MTGKSDGADQTFDNLNRTTRYKSSEGITTTNSYYHDDMRKSKKVGTDKETVKLDGKIVLSRKVADGVLYGVNFQN